MSSEKLTSVIFALSLFFTFLYSEVMPTLYNTSVDENKDKIIELYIGTFNRAPDVGGLNYWLNEMVNNGWSIDMVASSMFDQVETKELYPNSTSIEAFIDSVYLNVLNRVADDEGKAYWKDILEKKLVSREHFIIAIINGAKGNSKSIDDKNVLINKINVAKYFAIDKNQNDVKLAKEIMRVITSDSTSVEKAKSKVDEQISPLPPTHPIVESCILPVITDDSSFSDVFPSADIKLSNELNTVEDIASAFNNARAKDSTITKNLTMPTQSEWDAMSEQQKGLYLLNKERYDRGLKPFEGIDQNVIDVAQKYSQTLYSQGVFEHDADGDPWTRLDSIDVIKNNHDFFSYGENLYAYATTSSSFGLNIIAKAIYTWIYHDSGSSWGHREFCLAKLNDNSGENGVEGLAGFGVKQGADYEYFSGYNSVIVVMNAFDPSKDWNYSNTIKVSICPNIK